jgi:hypothetical protein
MPSSFPIPMQYPEVHIEKVWGYYIVTIGLPNSTSRPPRFVVQTLDEVFEIIKKYLGED